MFDTPFSHPLAVFPPPHTTDITDRLILWRLPPFCPGACMLWKQSSVWPHGAHAIKPFLRSLGGVFFVVLHCCITLHDYSSIRDEVCQQGREISRHGLNCVCQRQASYGSHWPGRGWICKVCVADEVDMHESFTAGPSNHQTGNPPLSQVPRRETKVDGLSA